MQLFISITIVFSLFSCANNTKKPIPLAINKLDTIWLNSFIKNSDTTYSKPYKRTDFVTANTYINLKDNSICQVMKDSAAQVRQVIISTKNR